jgi:molecular chaperone DnaJ
MDPKKNYYNILGVGENATLDEIKKAYRKLAKEYHPDTKGGDATAESRFKDISEAYAVLKDPKKRQEYDLMRKNPFSQGQSGGFGFGDFGEGGFRVNFGEQGESAGFDDILGNLFGFGRNRRNSQTNSYEDIFSRSRNTSPPRGRDFSANITIPFDLAVNGGETYVQTPTGKKVKLKIPVGVPEGKKVKMTGQGAPGPVGGQNGDLFITIHIAKHPKYDRQDNDIYTTVEINFAQALLGTEIEVETISNKKVKLKIPAGTDSGKIFKLKKLGIQSSNGSGDFYVKILISSPKNLSSRQRKLFQEWAKAAGLDY